MRNRFAIVTVIAALLPNAAMSAGPCKPDQHDSFVCGEGADAVRVLADTLSPSQKLAFAWHSSAGIVGKEFNPDDVEDVLIRIEDGQVLATLGGHYWESTEARPNRYGTLAVWSSDSRAVVEVANSRWESDSFAYYAVDGNAATKVDLRALVEPAMRARLPRAKSDGLVFRVHEELPITLDARGHLRFKTMLFVPKAEDSFDCQIEVDIAAAKRAAPMARIALLKRVKIDPQP